ncbi:FAD:protein FMN transferase [Amycolatopsis sp.]|uniref:FAD:protein FMN transferase n=1 Tax=Amycolatopsis sp. TaxID=37632 RepID=UPI002630B236|nr:FAD:protein FMN transferase [Amycolatopsis sp.]
MAAEAHFPVMGSTAHLIVVGGPPGLLEYARARLGELESRWSRFRPDSEISRLNTASGRWVRLSPVTVSVLRRAVQAWELTGGLYDPTVLTALENAGYTGSFETLPHTGPAGPATTTPSPGCAGIDITGRRARLPPEVRLDLGGIGKGYAADLLADDVVARGAEGVCVNLGGDVRVAGMPPVAGGWVVAISDETAPHHDLAHVSLAGGAVATSTRLRRRWRRGGDEVHHLIDPRTGAPSTSAVAAVTVVAAHAQWAEILAKAALIAGLEPGSALLETHSVAAILTMYDGTAHRVGPMERFECWTPSFGGTSPAPAD